MRFVASNANAHERPIFSAAHRCEELRSEAIPEPQHAAGLLRLRLAMTALYGRSPYKLPPFVPGLRVGLFGGSFNPPHNGHREASLLALRRLQLHRIWWLVSPGNPLKDARELAPLASRVEAARNVSCHPRIEVTAIEAAIGANYSFGTISNLIRRCPGVRFVWIMGADNFRQFDRWQRWRDIAKLVPIAIIDRPGFTLTATHGQAAETLAPYRRDETDGARLAMAAPPAFTFLHGPRWPMSSTALRARPSPKGAKTSRRPHNHDPSPRL